MSDGFVPSSGIAKTESQRFGTTLHSSLNDIKESVEDKISKPAMAATLASVVAMNTLAEPALAANGSPLLGAVAAYTHYLSLLIGTACLVTERLTVKANMSEEEENRITIADSVWGVSGVGVAISGYYRATQFEKGWEFYSHEPLFWFKMTLLAVLGASSLFPTVTIIKRAVEKKNAGSVAPVSEALAARMTSVINAELLAILSIPFVATLMARGIGYMDDFPWQAGAGVTGLTLVGLSVKYVKEALDWEEPTSEVEQTLN